MKHTKIPQTKIQSPCVFNWWQNMGQLSQVKIKKQPNEKRIYIHPLPKIHFIYINGNIRIGAKPVFHILRFYPGLKNQFAGIGKGFLNDQLFIFFHVFYVHRLRRIDIFQSTRAENYFLKTTFASRVPCGKYNSKLMKNFFFN